MASLPSYYANLVGSSEYELALLATWRQAKENCGNFDKVPFSKEDVVRHGDALRNRGILQRKLAVKNVPDIIYTYRARAELPGEILEHGNFAIIGRGKGLYAFVKIPRPNRIRLPDDMERSALKDALPKWVKPYMSKDEQGMLTSVSVNNLVLRHLRLKRAFRLQSHLRMSVDEYGQVEVDEVYLGKSQDGTHVGIAVEAKDQRDDDLLNISQLFGANRALRQLFPKIEHHLLGIKPGCGGKGICICEFTTPDDVSDLCEAGPWIRYDLI
jgi:hypothetical protein